jgi:competence protein ComEC
VEAVKPRGADRPWSPAVPGGDAETETTLAPRGGRGVDATPAEADQQSEE